MPITIDKFENAYATFSNFSPHIIRVSILEKVYSFRTNENFYQAMKSPHPHIWEQFTYVTPWEAKRNGQAIAMRSDWDDVKLGFMLTGLRIKFNDHIDAKDLLLSTGDAILVEGNYWGDIYWGKSAVTRHFKKHGRVVQTGEGENHLGRLLMQVREEIK